MRRCVGDPLLRVLQDGSVAAGGGDGVAGRTGVVNSAADICSSYPSACIAEDLERHSSSYAGFADDFGRT